jgi:hypothetical protein
MIIDQKDGFHDFRTKKWQVLLPIYSRVCHSHTSRSLAISLESISPRQNYNSLRTELCRPVWCIDAQGANTEFGIHLFLNSLLVHLAQQKPFLGA